MPSDPLVSIGIPTYNRPDGLERTLACACAQTWRNLDIVVSDNASTDPRVAVILARWEAVDPRIRILRQPYNCGPVANFTAALAAARGEFFAWYADDDILLPHAIAAGVAALNRWGPSLVAVAQEAQYLDGTAQLPFFAEGKAFYGPPRPKTVDRVRHLIDNCYGDLAYSLFRTTSIRRPGFVFQMNEIPLFIHVVGAGGWLTMPQIGLIKATNRTTYLQARWETLGGRLQRPFSLHSFADAVRYHLKVWLQCLGTISRLPCALEGRLHLAWHLGISLAVHTWRLTVSRRKPIRQTRRHIGENLWTRQP